MNNTTPTSQKPDPAEQEALKVEVAPITKSIKYMAYFGALTPDDATLRERGNGRGYQLYDELERDPVAYSYLQKRKMALVGKPYSLRVADEGAAGAERGLALAKKMVDLIDFDTLCHQLMDATLKGFAVAELVWRPDVWVEGFGYAWLPIKALGRDQDRFRFVAKPDGSGEIELRLVDNLLGMSASKSNDGMQGVPLPDFKFIVHRYASKSGDPYGRGLGSELYWPVYFKREVQAFWAEHLEKFGQPIPTAEYPDIGFGEDDQRKLIDALKAMRRNGAAVYPKGVVLNLLNPANAGAASYENFMHYQDESIAQIVTGETKAKGSGGAQAAAAMDRREVRDDIVKADGDLLSNTLNSSLFAWIAELNGVPRCMVDRNLEQAQDIQIRSAVDTALFAIGWQPTPERIAEVYGAGYEARVITPSINAGASNQKANQDLGIQFAENENSGLALVDHAAAALPAEALKRQQDALVKHALDLVQGTSSFAEAKTALQKAFATMPTQQLETALARAMFAAQTLAQAKSANQGAAK